MRMFYSDLEGKEGTWCLEELDLVKGLLRAARNIAVYLSAVTMLNMQQPSWMVQEKMSGIQKATPSTRGWHHYVV